MVVTCMVIVSLASSTNKEISWTMGFKFVLSLLDVPSNICNSLTPKLDDALNSKGIK